MGTASVFLPAAISAIVGFGFAHYISKKIPTNTKFRKVLNFLLFCSLGVGITGVLNEILIASVLGTAIKMDKIIMFVFSNMIVLPTLFFAIGFAFEKYSGKTFSQSTQENTNVESSSTESNFLNKKSIAISTGILLTGLLLGLSGKSLFNTDEFVFSDCTICSPKSGCENNQKFKGFKVLENSVQIFMLDSNNMDRIFNLPIDDKMKCTVVRSHNNAFECSSYETGEYLTTSTQAAFDGKSKFIYNSLMLSAHSSNVISDSKMTCTVK